MKSPSQETIEGDRVGEGKLNGQQCEWCQERATHALPIFRKLKGGKAGAKVETGMFTFCCDAHLDVCERSNPVRKAL